MTLTLSQGATIYLCTLIVPLIKNSHTAISEWLITASIAELGIRHAEEPSSLGKHFESFFFRGFDTLKIFHKFHFCGALYETFRKCMCMIT